jgi:hypothetical protein
MAKTSCSNFRLEDIVHRRDLQAGGRSTRRGAMASRVLLTMMPATTGTAPSTSSQAISLSRLNSSAM